MKLTIKSLKQVVYPIEVESDQIEVLELKKQIEALHQFDHLNLNLVFNGSKLVDSKKLCEYNIKEDNVIIMMSSKVKPVNVNSQPQLQEEAKKEEKVENKPTTTSTSTNAQGQQAHSAQSTQPKPKKDYSGEVKMLMDMGFPKSESESAISAARGNINVAIEFLSNGIPDNLPVGDDEAGEDAELTVPLPQPILAAAAAATLRLYCKLYMLFKDLKVVCNRWFLSRSTSMRSSLVAIFLRRSISRLNLASFSWKPPS